MLRNAFAGSFRLFRAWGINVYLHWTWFLLLTFQISRRQQGVSPAQVALELVTVFVIVLLHEFGHALACRSTGGCAEFIVLWPLGGIAFVSPPPRPGAVLWSIAAGPLVNVALLLPTYLLWHALSASESAPWIKDWAESTFLINLALLIFNMLPIYPLDGGQIVQSLLWFVVGRATSLLIVAVLGLVVAAAVAGLALWKEQTWLLVMMAFIGWRAWSGFREARYLLQLQRQQADPQP